MINKKTLSIMPKPIKKIVRNIIPNSLAPKVFDVLSINQAAKANDKAIKGKRITRISRIQVCLNSNISVYTRYPPHEIK